MPTAAARAKSTVFRNAFKDPVLPGANDNEVLILPSTSADIFTTVEQWFQGGKLKDEDDDLTQQQCKDLYERLLRIWVFGHQNGIPTLQNDAMDALVNTLVLRPLNHPVCGPRIFLDFIYQQTPKGSALRKLMVELAAHAPNNGSPLIVKKSAYPKEFIVELVEELLEYVEVLKGMVDWEKYPDLGPYWVPDAKEYHV